MDEQRINKRRFYCEVFWDSASTFNQLGRLDVGTLLFPEPKNYYLHNAYIGMYWNNSGSIAPLLERAMLTFQLLDINGNSIPPIECETINGSGGAAATVSIPSVKRYSMFPNFNKLEINEPNIGGIYFENFTIGSSGTITQRLVKFLCTFEATPMKEVIKYMNDERGNN